jgi:hypothetical protein
MYIEQQLINLLKINNLPYCKPDHVYHYTTLEALIGIIENNEFWLSERNCMNDMNDENYIKNIVKEIQLSDGRKDFEGSTFDEDFIDNRSQYVFSTSIEEDIAHQWLSYGKNNPVCIKFNTQELIEYFAEFAGEERKTKTGDFYEIKQDLLYDFTVLYDKLKIRNIASVLVKEYEKAYSLSLQFPNDNEKGQEYISQRLIFQFFYAIVKQKEFYAENEYRFLIFSDRAPAFRPTTNKIVQFIKIKCMSNKKIPVKSIIIGRKCYNDTTTTVIRRMLLSKEYDPGIKIIPSNLYLQ